MSASSRIADLLSLPVWPEDPLPAIRELGRMSMVVALDDDPTGTQTVRDVPVLTRWTVDRLSLLLAGDDPLGFLLTNSRSLPARQAAALATKIGRSLRDASRDGRRTWAVISRSDSTLRGHYPAEIDPLITALGVPDARILLAPYFGDGGRLTIDGIHHLRTGDHLLPVADTDFARDAVFGYQHSDLRGWVGERTSKTAGARPREVAVVTLDRIRSDGPVAVRDALLDLPEGGVLAVDSAAERDIEVVALGALMAERMGVPLIGRTAASYVRARAGLRTVQPLGRHEVEPGRPGLVVVGSHVPMTTTQLDRLLTDPPVPVAPLELSVEELLADDDDRRRTRIGALAAAADAALRGGVTPVVMSSRSLQRGADSDADLAISATVSAALVSIVQAIETRPSWVVSKGGITSSDIATLALGMEEARIVGPLLAGVPLWRSGPDARWPGLCLLVFPGNVGGPDAVRQAVAILSRSHP